MKHLISLRALPLLLLLLCIGTVISATTLRAYASEQMDDRHVFDQAGLLSTTEADEIEKLCIDYGKDANVEIMILTHEDSNATANEDYIGDFEDQLPSGNRVYLLINMYNRVVTIHGYGTVETYLHSKRINAINEKIEPYLSDADYKQAMILFIKEVAAYMKDDTELNYDYDYRAGSDTAKSILTNVWFHLIASIIIGVTTVSIMAYHSGGRMTVGSSTYMDAGQSGLIGRRDDYIRTHVTRVRKPKDNNSNHQGGSGINAGGFRGGVTRGGRSHSSGSRKF